MLFWFAGIWYFGNVLMLNTKYIRRHHHERGQPINQRVLCVCLVNEELRTIERM